MFSLCGPRLDSLFLLDFIVTLKSTKCVFMTNKLLIKRCPNEKICFWCLTELGEESTSLRSGFFLSPRLIEDRILLLSACKRPMRYDEMLKHGNRLWIK